MQSYQTLLGQAVKQFLQGQEVRIFMLMTSLARVGDLWVIQSVFRQQGDKYMGVGVAGFRALGDSGHVATDAVGERVDGMGQVVVYDLVTVQTLLRTGPFCLKLRGRQAELMNVVTGRTGNPFSGMGGMLPIEVLLVVSLGELVGIDVLEVPSGIRGGFIIESQGTTRHITDRPLHPFHFCGHTSIVTRTADLRPECDGKVGRVYNRQTFVEDGRLR